MDPLPPVIPPAETPPARELKPGTGLLVVTTLLVMLNMWLGFARTMRAGGNVSEALGAATSQLVLPVIVTVLFSISQRFRNARSRTKIVLWTSVLILLAALGNAGRR